MSTWSRDTTPEARAALIRAIRGLTPEAKMLQVAALTRSAREFAMAGLRARHPSASPEELRRRFAALVLDADLARKVYGWDPTQEGY